MPDQLLFLKYYDQIVIDNEIVPSNADIMVTLGKIIGKTAKATKLWAGRQFKKF